MIRAIRIPAMAQDPQGLIAGWNVLPNFAYSVVLSPGAAACGVMLFDESRENLIATGAAPVGTASPCMLFPMRGQFLDMVDPDLGWHLLVSTQGTEAQCTVRIGPAADLPDEVHPVYADEALALARATAIIDAGTHQVQTVTARCPLGPGTETGGILSVPVDGSLTVGQLESMTLSATPDSADETLVIRRHISVEPYA